MPSPVDPCGAWTRPISAAESGNKKQEQIWSWGENASGQIGDGTTTDRHSAVLIGSAPYTYATTWILADEGKHSLAYVLAQKVDLAPASQSRGIRASASLTANVTQFAPTGGTPTPANIPVTFKVIAGPSYGRTGTVLTDAHGKATFSYSRLTTGTDMIVAQVGSGVYKATSNRATVSWVICRKPLPCKGP